MANDREQRCPECGHIETIDPSDGYDAQSPAAPQPARCNNPLHYHTDGSPAEHEIGPSCMATVQPATDEDERKAFEEENIASLLAELDGIARDVDNYDYGLPIHNEEQHGYERMVNAVRGWLARSRRGAQRE